MFLADYHVHSEFSQDASFPMAEMAQAAEARGIKELMFTDHIDIEWGRPEGLIYNPGCFDNRGEVLTSFREAREKFSGRVNLLLGGEVCSINHCPDIAAEIAASGQLDFIIGSVHNLKDVNDFIFLKYTSRDQLDKMIPQYLNECAETARTGLCDVIGHIGYFRKYTVKQGMDFEIMDYRDHLASLFKTLVETGVGIEVNTSGLRHEINDFIPSLPVLKMYREAGGEIITAGSDSHVPQDAGAGIADAYEILREAGFRYITLFRERQPEFVKL